MNRAAQQPGQRTSTFRVMVLWAALASLLATSTAFAEDRAEVDLKVGTTAEPWTGQQVTLSLDLKTPALSFSEIHFDLPEVTGALVLQTDSTTVKLSERRGRDTWQILRYPITLFPQQAGELTVPPFEVRFKTLAGFGTEPTSHQLNTGPLALTVRQPPGLAPGKVVVTTPELSVTANWALPPEPIRAGDALTLTVERRAVGLSAMLLPAVPVFEVDGLAAYPAAPDIADRTNRGSLVGNRTDRITWIIEGAGDYALPTVVFRWWDPTTETLRTERIEGVSLTAQAAPGQTPSESSPLQGVNAGRPTGLTGLQLTIGGLVLLLLIAAMRFRKRLAAFFTRARHRILPPARALLRTLNPGASS